MGDKYIKALDILSCNVLKNLSTLKYLSIYKNHSDIKIMEASNNWAVMVTFPTSILSYDTATYPKATKAIFLNGTSDKLKHDLLNTLTPDNYILRLNQPLELSGYRDSFTISTGYTYISFTCSVLNETPKNKGILPNSRITREAIEMFGRNGYTPDDLVGYFENGAQWFGLTNNVRLVSACFVFRNYGEIWEIAGVHTLKEERRHRYAGMVVSSALNYLLERGLTPRYEAEQDNRDSIHLARHLGMKEFLTIRHYLLESR